MWMLLYIYNINKKPKSIHLFKIIILIINIMTIHEVRLRTYIFNMFCKHFTPNEILDILEDMNEYFSSHNAHQLYDLIHNNQ